MSEDALKKIKAAREKLDQEEFDLLNKAAAEVEKTRLLDLERAWVKAEGLKEQRTRLAQAIQDSIDAVKPLITKLIEISAQLKSDIPETDGTQFFDSPLGPHRMMEKLTDYMAKIGWPYVKQNPMIDLQDVMSFVDFVNKEGNGWAFKYRQGKPIPFDGRIDVPGALSPGRETMVAAEKAQAEAAEMRLDPRMKKPKISMSNLTKEIM